MEPYFMISESGSGEITEKKSRFIANIIPVQTAEEAQHFIEETKKKYWDARHNCYAFIIGRRSELMRFSDDGEPPGTAGKPIMEVLRGAGLTFAAAVVTRYFGGTLLGTGGLIRAYTQAVQTAIGNTAVVKMRYCSALTVQMEYADVGKIQYLLGKENILLLRSRYEEKAAIDIMVPHEDTDTIVKAITEAAQARALISLTGEQYWCLD